MSNKYNDYSKEALLLCIQELEQKIVAFEESTKRSIIQIQELEHKTVQLLKLLEAENHKYYYAAQEVKALKVQNAELEQQLAEMERTAGLRWPNHYAAREEGRKESKAKIQELEQQLEECKLDLRMAITKEQDLVDAEIEIANMKAKNAKLFDALKKIANKKWIVEHRPANEMQDIANAALKEVLNGQV